MDDAYLGVVKKEKKMIAKEEVNKFRTTARVVGIVYILGFVVGLVGIGLFTSILGAPDHLSTVSANSVLLGFAAVLWLMAVIGDAAHSQAAGRPQLATHALTSVVFPKPAGAEMRVSLECTLSFRRLIK
jgi:hypothetical protein